MQAATGNIDQTAHFRIAFWAKQTNNPPFIYFHTYLKLSLFSPSQTLLKSKAIYLLIFLFTLIIPNFPFISSDKIVYSWPNCIIVMMIVIIALLFFIYCYFPLRNILLTAHTLDIKVWRWCKTTPYTGRRADKKGGKKTCRIKIAENIDGAKCKRHQWWKHPSTFMTGAKTKGNL